VRAPEPIDAAKPVVLVVDDNAGIRSALRRLLISSNLSVELYSSGAELLADARFDRPGCLVLDIGMPGMSGLEVQTELKHRKVMLPIVFLTGTAEIPIAVAAMREGATDFVEKPFDNEDLVARVRRAIDIHEHGRRNAAERETIVVCLQTLTPREREVMELVVAGRTNKEIARLVDASHRTIEIHRSHLMEKMRAPSLAELVRKRLLVGAS
jgi:FixJ family two-component response regulator